MLLKLLKQLIGQKQTSIKSETQVKLKTEWENIAKLLKQETPSSIRQALIAADRSLDTALTDLSDLKTMGDRLKDTKRLFEETMYNKIWKAHKLRNSIVHEAGFEPPHFIVKEAIEDLKKGLLSLKVNL